MSQPVANGVTPIALDQNWKTAVRKENLLKSQWPEKYGFLPGEYEKLQQSQKDVMMTTTPYGAGAHPKMTEYGINYGNDDNVRITASKIAEQGAAAASSSHNAHLTTNNVYGAGQNSNGTNPLEDFRDSRNCQAKRDVNKVFGWPHGSI